MITVRCSRSLYVLLVASIVGVVVFFIYHSARTVAAVTLSDRVVITTSDGAAHTFLKSEAVDKGSFNSPAGFTQRNLCDTDSSMPYMAVCFRPDTDASRDEVVFEYGSFMQPPKNTGAYVATFYSGSTQLAQKSVSNQYFYQRWRWVPQGYRPRYRTVASLEGAKLLAPYRKGVDPQAQNDNIPNPPTNCAYVNVFDKACITEYMPTTGERDDIGPITGFQGGFLLSGSEAWWQVVLSQAEAGMGVPWNIRDEGGTPINFFRTTGTIVDRHYLTTHSNSWGQSHNLDRHTDNNTGWGLDQAHQPALFYLPWVLTGDPYYLEGMQFANSSNTLYTNWDRQDSNLADLMEDEIRGRAWNIRTLVGLVATTPDNVPGWLLPRSYYQRQSLENAQKAMRTFVNSTNSMQSVLHAYSNGFWQHDFFTFEVGWATWLGLSEWKPVYDFAIQNQLARVNGTSGWERRCPTVYYIPDTTYTSWSQAWQTESTTNNHIPPSNGLLCNVDPYTSYLLGVLGLATYIGTPGADTYYVWLHDMMTRTLDSGEGYTSGSKWAVAPAYVVNNLPLPKPSTSPAPIITFSAAPSSVTAGQSTTLTWTTANATSCTGNSFNTSGVSGSNTVSPSQTTTYTLTCSGVGGSTSQSVTVSVTNTPPAPTPTPTTGGLIISSINTSGDFQQANTCPSTLTNGSSCTISVTFVPSALGSQTGTLIINHNQAGSPLTVALSGGGEAATAPSAPQPPPAPTSPPTSSGTNPSAPTSGLLNYWSFDDTNSAGSFTGAAILVTGRSGKALSLNGNSYSTISFQTTNSFSWSVWVKPNNINGNILENRIDTADIDLYLEYGVPVFGWWNGHINILKGGSIPLNTWTHIVGTYNGSSRKLYVNGILVGSDTPQSPDVGTGLMWQAIGRADDGTGWSGGLDSGFNGLIDEVRVYNRALTDSEVSALYQSVSSQSTSSVTPTFSSFHSLYQSLLDLTSSLTLRVLSLLGASNQLAQVSGSGAVLSVNPTSLAFNSQTVGTQSAPKTVTLTYNSAAVTPSPTPTPTPTPTPSGSVAADLKVNNSDNSITVSQGSMVTLSWTSSGATSCVVSPNIAGGLSGAQQITASTNATYTLTCTNGGTDAIDIVTVNVQAPTTPPATSTQYLKRTLYYWMWGSDVKTLQRFLMREGYLAPNNDSGFYGTLTRKAVYDFKCKENISCTSLSRSGSIVGGETRALINERLTARPL